MSRSAAYAYTFLIKLCSCFCRNILWIVYKLHSNITSFYLWNCRGGNLEAEQKILQISRVRCDESEREHFFLNAKFLVMTKPFHPNLKNIQKNMFHSSLLFNSYLSWPIYLLHSATVWVFHKMNLIKRCSGSVQLVLFKYNKNSSWIL